MRFLTALCLGASLALSAPVGAAPELSRWSARLAPGDARAGEGAQVILTAVVAGGWHLYSTTQPPGGSQRTSIVLLLGAGLRASGRIAQPSPAKQPNAAFKITDELYQGAVAFGVPVVLAAGVRGRQRGVVQVRFQLCSDRLCSPLQTVRLPFWWTPRAGRARAARRAPLTGVPAQPKTHL